VRRRQRRQSGRGCLGLVILCLIVVGGVALIPQARREVRAHVPFWSTLRSHIPLGTTNAALQPVVCRKGNVLAQVQDPSKLELLQPCVVASGVVIFKFRNTDGDWHIQILPTNRGTAHLLNKHNLAEAGGTLVVEVIPADQAAVTLPHLGSRVRVTGALVTDRGYGWHELHPAWQIVALSP